MRARLDGLVLGTEGVPTRNTKHGAITVLCASETHLPLVVRKAFYRNGDYCNERKALGLVRIAPRCLDPDLSAGLSRCALLTWLLS